MVDFMRQALFFFFMLIVPLIENLVKGKGRLIKARSPRPTPPKSQAKLGEMVISFGVK